MKFNNKKQNKIHMINTNQIFENPYQPRETIDNEKLKGLIQSIRKNGIIQPLSIRIIDKNKYELIYGHRRLEAAKALEMPTVPCIINDISNQNSFIFALIENIQREKLSFLEEARAIEKLIQTYKLTQAEVALRLGMSQPAIANKLRLLKLSDRQIERIKNFSLSERHARALLRLQNESERDDMLSEIIIKGLNVEQTNKQIDLILKPKTENQHNDKFVVKDIRLFVNSINKAIKVMKHSGIPAKSERKEDENFIKYTVTIPKQ